MWKSALPGPRLYALTLSWLFCLTLLVGLTGTFVPIDTVPTLYEFRRYASFPSRADLDRPTAIPAKLTSFFNDNFGGRKLLVREYFRFRLRALHGDVGLPLVYGKDGWLISADEVESYRNDPAQISPSQLERMRVVLNSWCSYARDRGAVLVFVVGPNKTTIHPQIPDYYPKKTDISTIDRLNELKIDCPLIKVDLRETLRVHAKYLPLYYKWGTHWNNFATLLAWKEIKAAVAKTKPNITWPTAELTLAQRLALPWEDSMWQWFGLADPEQVKVPNPTYSDRKYDTTGSAERAKVLAFGDSFLAWMRPTVFEVADTYSDWSMKPYDPVEYTAEDLAKDAWIVAVVPERRNLELMNVYKPNVVILEIVERSIMALADLPIPPDPK